MKKSISFLKDEEQRNNLKESMIEKEIHDKLNLSTEGENNDSKRLINLKLLR